MRGASHSPGLQAYNFHQYGWPGHPQRWCSSTDKWKRYALYHYLSGTLCHHEWTWIDSTTRKALWWAKWSIHLVTSLPSRLLVSCYTFYGILCRKVGLGLREPMSSGFWTTWSLNGYPKKLIKMTAFLSVQLGLHRVNAPACIFCFDFCFFKTSVDGN